MMRSRSLLLRMVLTLVAAFAAVFFVIGGIVAYLTLDSASGQLPRQIRQVTQVLALQLAKVDRPDDIARLGDLLDALQRENEPRGRLSWTVILDQAGRPVYAPPELPAINLASIADGAARVELGGNAFNVFAQDAKPWRIIFIDNANARRADVMRQIATYLFIFVVISLVLVLAPIWLATRSSLTPLRRLSEAVKARRMDDLTPVTLPETYRELDPLVRALNELMATLAQGIRREKSFVHDAAHEMRTPLAVITTQAHLLANAESGESHAQAEQQLLAAIQRASHLVHQLLRLAQLDARERRKHDEFDIMDLVRNCVADFAVRPEYARADLGVSGPDQLVGTTDRHAFQSVLENLLDNALRYGGPLVKVDIDVAVNGQSIQLQVTDNGPGISETMRAKVFERFTRGNNDGKPGSGLGLAIVAEAIKAMNGSIQLDAAHVERGCRFLITLPATIPAVNATK